MHVFSSSKVMYGHIISLICRSVVELWRYMSKFTGVKILLGDLNAEPQSTPIRQVVINVLFVFMKLKL